MYAIYRECDHGFQFHWSLFCPPEKRRATVALSQETEKEGNKSEKKTGWGRYFRLPLLPLNSLPWVYTFTTAQSHSLFRLLTSSTNNSSY